MNYKFNINKILHLRVDTWLLILMILAIVVAPELALADVSSSMKNTADKILKYITNAADYGGGAIIAGLFLKGMFDSVSGRGSIPWTSIIVVGISIICIHAVTSIVSLFT